MSFSAARADGVTGYTEDSLTRKELRTLAETTNAASDKLYKAEYVGSGTFIISKPKRKKTKQRQTNLKNVRRGSRK